MNLHAKFICKAANRPEMGRYCVRPSNITLGTHGWINGQPWMAKFVTAPDEQSAVVIAEREGGVFA